ncbi:MAG: TM2 domain-containing protein [Propionibacteriaceae bacterium]|jgi:TM2 domain-containing membrane protein YozV|nr:TM2 domain-containing protein [Propionibacteriaceae bacterium]
MSYPYGQPSGQPRPNEPTTDELYGQPGPSQYSLYEPGASGSSGAPSNPAQPYAAYGATSQQQGAMYPTAYGQNPPNTSVNVYMAAQQYPVAYGAQKSKVAAGLLGIFLGGLGVHNFYLGNTGKGVAQLLITLLSLGFLAWVSVIWGLIEGILILVAQPGSPWGTDAAGRPLAN